ncbi:MAG TPA: glycine zipper domain-containing protein [Gemmatimonadaceae bacterium]|nr:glycine zipper domain-containing protein [Gemmatimonadaceae bacterium]
MRAITLALASLVFAGALPLAAQAGDSAAIAAYAAKVASVKKQLGLIVFPAKGQTADQQATDEKDCYAWSQKETGIDPTAPGANADSAAAAAKAKTDSAAQGAAVKGAAKGAAAGALIGAAAGDAGTGAAVGATAGALKGRQAKQKAQKQAAQQGANAANAQNQAQLDTFKKGWSACLTGKGYTVQ